MAAEAEAMAAEAEAMAAEAALVAAASAEAVVPAAAEAAPDAGSRQNTVMGTALFGKFSRGTVPFWEYMGKYGLSIL